MVSLRTLFIGKIIFIEAADKMAAIVIMDKSNYDDKVLRQLENTSFQKKLKWVPIKEYLGELQQLLEAGVLNGDISPKESKMSSE